jgi:hypothetical protein
VKPREPGLATSDTIRNFVSKLVHYSVNVLFVNGFALRSAAHFVVMYDSIHC